MNNRSSEPETRNKKPEIIIEIATADFITTQQAVEGGADRIELCAALGDGGTTPSLGMIKKCREAFEVPLFPIIRVRGGDFLYTQEEFEIMLNDVILCKNLGCDGIVTGMLQTEGNLDVARMTRLVEQAYPMEVTCHRAFDRCLDPFVALEQLIDMGCTRILTSGQQPTAFAGAELIAELVTKADNRIIIMPGSGVRKENIRELAQKTGATEFHTSLRGKKKSAMDFIHPSFSSSEESYTNPFVDASAIRAIRKELKDLSH